ncbi:hypothetical protein M413DRAFT_29535 [Hebeloma cylindrosporum]|uniref:Uncharacterized protein n=1 Tax=Hebeloma cylindrosporum TaxID=76867 RepID=A0A0C3BRR1_HEBCY|nr:hypothetical protein M413DRAFT_29535 [Hebeloma cylindrosporum h7]
MSSPSIHAFKPFNLGHGSTQEVHVKVQEIIYYGESRFRQATAAMTKAEARHQGWMQECLKQELSFIMSYVGIATTMGLVVEVPIVLRSLAVSLGPVPTDELPIPFDLGFIALLEVGTNCDQFGRVVNSYRLNWWDNTRSPAEHRRLTAQTLEACLQHHRFQLSLDPNGLHVPSKPIRVIIPPLQLHGSAAPSTAAEIDCRNCDRYRSLADDLMDEMRNLENLSAAMEASTSNEVEIAKRRTAGFYILNERVTLKELQSKTITVDGVGTGTRAQKTSRHVRQIAREDLRRFQSSADQKWTYGEPLTVRDILNLRHVSGQRNHTGYDTSLDQGRLRGEFSDNLLHPIPTVFREC